MTLLKKLHLLYALRKEFYKFTKDFSLIDGTFESYNVWNIDLKSN